MDGSVGQWVGSGHITKYRIDLDLIETIQFSLKIYDLLRHSHLWMHGLMGGLMSNHSNQINLDLIKIIQLWTFLTFFGHFYLNHVSPLWGYFLRMQQVFSNIYRMQDVFYHFHG